MQSTREALAVALPHAYTWNRAHAHACAIAFALLALAAVISEGQRHLMHDNV